MKAKLAATGGGDAVAATPRRRSYEDRGGEKSGSSVGDATRRASFRAGRRDVGALARVEDLLLCALEFRGVSRHEQRAPALARDGQRGGLAHTGTASDDDRAARRVRSRAGDERERHKSRYRGPAASAGRIAASREHVNTSDANSRVAVDQIQSKF